MSVGALRSSPKAPMAPTEIEHLKYCHPKWLWFNRNSVYNLTTVTLRASTNHQFLHEKLVPIRQILWFLRSKFIQNSDRIPLSSVVSNKSGVGNSPFSSFRVSVKFVNISKTVRPKLLLITNRKSHVSFRLTPWHGRRAFSVAVSATWNCLSDELREPLLSYCEQFQTVTLYSFVRWVVVHTAH